MKNKILLFASLCVYSLQLLAGNVKVNAYFQSHMVLQQNQPIEVWGTADKATEVKVVLGNDIKHVTADESGKWKVRFRNRKATFKPLTLRVDNQEFTDILVGDVWLCSGQSNMAFAMASTDKETQDIQDKESLFSSIRLLNYHTIPILPNKKTGYTKEQIARCTKERMFTCEWKRTSQSALQNFSAVATHFGLTLAENLNIPVGLINCSVGGSAINNWIPEHLLRTNPLTAHWFTQDWLTNEEIRVQHRNRFSISFQQVVPAGSPYIIGTYPFHFLCEPSFLYESSIGHLTHLHVKGVLWYQGEADTSNESMIGRYPALYKLLVNGWRHQFQDEKLPFIAIQLPSFSDTNWPLFRKVQQEINSQLKYTYLVPSIDQGELNDIHYKHKKTIGSRAAYRALAAVYKQPTIQFPELKNYRVKKNELIIHFTGVGNGIEFPAGKVPTVELIDQKGQVRVSEMRKVGANQIAITMPANQIVKVRYAWKSYLLDSPLAVNSDQIPLMPFELTLAN